MLLLLCYACWPQAVVAQTCSANTTYQFIASGGDFPLIGATLNTGTSTFTQATLNTDPLFGGTGVATVNGSYFYNIFDDGTGTAEFYTATLGPNGQGDITRTLSADSGLPQTTFALATADGETFFFMSDEGGNVVLRQGTLQQDGTFSSLTILNSNLTLPSGGITQDFGTRDGTNFEFIVTDGSGTAALHSGVLSGGSFSYTLLNADSGASNTAFAYAAAVSTVELLSNSPVCAGEHLLLNATNNYAMGVLSYSWTGPDGFTSSEQNPQLTGFTSANAGTYNLTVTFRNGETASCTINVTEAAASACNANCDCKENVYVNDISNNLTHKFETQASGDYVEVNSPWLPYDNVLGVVDSPHGVSIDANGFLYISELDDVNLVQLDCDGNVTDANAEVVGAFNTAVVGNYLFANGVGIAGTPNEVFIDVFDLCDNSTAFTGFVRLGDQEGTTGDIFSWGLALNPNDGFLYAGDNYNGDNANFEAGNGDIFRIDPTNPDDPGSVWQTNATIAPINIGQNLGRVMGITFDAAGAMYIVDQSVSGQNTNIRKFTGSGNTWTQVAISSDNFYDLEGYTNGWGISWIPTTNELLVTSFAEDCVARVDPNTLDYLGPAIPHVPGAIGKAVDVVTECCYRGPTSFTVSACEGQVNFLRDDILNCAVCGGTWTRLSGSGGSYDDCGQTFTVDATTTTSVFRFSSTNDRCGTVNVDITIEVANPSATASTTVGDCTGITPNDNAQINLTAISGDKVGIGTGSNYTGGPDFATAIDLSGATTYDFTGLMPNTQYTARVYTTETCFVDYPLTTPVTNCCTTPSATVTPVQGDCVGGAVTDNATIELTAISNGDIVGVSAAGSGSYNGPPYNASAASSPSLFAVSGSTATVTGLMHNTQYTVRLFDMTNDCLEDFTVTTPNLVLPSVSFTAPTDVCVDNGILTGQGGGSPTGGAYSGPGVSDNSNGMTYSFNPEAAGVGTHTITYTFTDGNGCTNSASDDIEVFALPTVTFAALENCCQNDGVQMGLGGGSPMGGTYSGPGVTDNGNGTTFDFDPAAAGVGLQTITYTFTDANGCTDSATTDKQVFPPPRLR